MSFSILYLGLLDRPKSLAYEKIGIINGTAELNFSNLLVRQRSMARLSIFGGGFPGVRMPANVYSKIIVLVMHFRISQLRT